VKPFILILLLFPFQAYAGCVASYCADGYTGCGCGPDSAECCRRRLQGSDGDSGSAQTPAPDMELFNAGMEMMQRNMQMQQQQQQLRIEMMKRGDEQLGEKVLTEGAEFDAYQRQKDQQRIEKNDEINSIKDQLIDIDTGFKPLKIENSVHQMKYKKESEEKYGKKPDRPSLERVEQSTEKQAPHAVAPKRCQQSSADFPNRCITTACGMTSSESLCCPKDYPYLNHCNCMCYESTDFACGGYSACQHYREN
jgi:hypothetical protein